MAKFAYNNVKNANTSHTSFELNYGYQLHIFYKKDIDFCSKSKLIDKLLIGLQELMIMYRENFNHAQAFQKLAHDKAI